MKPLETTVREVLVGAIASEIATRDLYRVLAGNADDPHARAKLLELSDRQIQHRLALEKRYRELVGEEPPAAAQPDVTVPPNVGTLDLARVLRIALEHERESESNFRFLAERADSPELLRLFNELAEMEWKHKAEIQNEYDALGVDPESMLFE
ncbi:MAG: ferritin family protein [Thermoanaerobaculia bacterium]